MLRVQSYEQRAIQSFLLLRKTKKYMEKSLVNNSKQEV